MSLFLHYLSGNDPFGNLNNAMITLSSIIARVVGDGIVFLQSVGILITSIMMTYYKINEMMAGNQEDQIYSQKANKALKAFILLLIVPTFIKILQNYFGSPSIY